MKTWLSRISCLIFFVCLLASAARAQAASASLAVLPLFFEPADASNAPASFLARGQNYQFFINATEASIVLRKVKAAAGAEGASGLYEARASRQLYTRVARARFLNASPSAAISGENQMPGVVNYLIGNDPAQWRTKVSTYGQVRVRGLYPGIDLLYYGNQQQLEYDFIIAPGADPAAILLRYDGVNRLKIGAAGELVITLGTDEISQPAPQLYQIVAGARHPVGGGYQLQGPRTVRFNIGDYDHTLPLQIDPILTYSTYFGGNFGDEILGVKLDTNGAVYVAGETVSTTFPFALPPGGFTAGFQGGRINGDAFVAKFDSGASNLVYFTYLGGFGNDGALDLGVDGAGRAYVTGFTDSTNFPVANALFPNLSGKRFKGLRVFQTDAFVTELNETGSGLIYSTYLGGGFTDRGIGIALDSSGAASITGFTASTNFPVTASAYQKTLAGSNDVFVTKLAPGGAALLYSTYLGGTNLDEGLGIAVDPGGLIYITGYTASTNFPLSTNALQTQLNQSTNATKDFKKKRVPLDAFVARLDPSASGPASLLYSTLLGGTNNDSGFRIALDSQTNVYVAGNSSSLDFLNTNHLVVFPIGTNKNYRLNSDAFLTKFSFNSGGASVEYSALFGGWTNDTAWGLAVAPSGEVFLTGITTSTNFPVTNVSGPFLRATNSGKADVFVMALNTNASQLLYSAFLGGKGNDYGYAIAVDPFGTAYVAGQTLSTNFPTVDAQQRFRIGTNDAFLARIELDQPLTPPAPPPVVQPTLTVALVGNQIELSWSAQASDFTLQETTNLLSSSDWVTVPGPLMPVITNGLVTVFLPATNQALFFRLQK
jgi:hypothetical protein